MAILVASRRITWVPGVDGGIPSYSVDINATDAPYNAVGNGVADDTSAIQDALNACTSGQAVYLPAGTYKITSELTIPSNVVLRGAGKDISIIKGGSGSGVSYLVGMYASMAHSSLYEAGKSITGGVTKDSTSLTISSHGYSVDDFLLITSEDDDNENGDPMFTNDGDDGNCSWCGIESGERSMGQVVKVTAVPNANTVTLEKGLYYAYPNSPQANRLDSDYITSGAGLEDLTLDNTSSYNGSQANYGTVMMVGTVDCWLDNVEIDMVYRQGVNFLRCYRNTMHGCTVHRSYAYTSSAGYGIYLQEVCGDCLIENNYFHDLTTGFTFNGATSGNVFAYNYITDIKSTEYPTATRDGFASHGAHPMMNLFESNYLDGPKISADFYWGTSSHNTLLRNRVKIDTDKTNEVANISIMKGSEYYNSIGNVLGVAGHEDEYELKNLFGGLMIYNLDYLASDTDTSDTLIRHGDYDTVTDGVTWDLGIADHDIPDSYYLDSQPSWWGSGGWPVIGSDLTPMASTIPADPNYVPTESAIGVMIMMGF